jgi:hypothetical protein
MVFLQSGGEQIFETSRRNRKILGHPEDPQTLCAIVQNSVVMATWCPENLHPWLQRIQKIALPHSYDSIHVTELPYRNFCPRLYRGKISFEFVKL